MNHWTFQIGTTLYFIHLWLWGYLGVRAWRHRRYYFLLFCTVLGLVSIVRFWLFTHASFDLYSRVYWITDPFDLLAGILFLCELLPYRKGIMASAVTAAGIQAIHPTFQLEGIVGYLVGGICGWLVFWKKENGLARGMMIAMLFPAIAERLPVLSSGGYLRFVPTVSFVIAQLIWIENL